MFSRRQFMSSLSMGIASGILGSFFPKAASAGNDPATDQVKLPFGLTLNLSEPKGIILNDDQVGSFQSATQASQDTLSLEVSAKLQRLDFKADSASLGLNHQDGDSALSSADIKNLHVRLGHDEDGITLLSVADLDYSANGSTATLKADIGSCPLNWASRLPLVGGNFKAAGINALASSGNTLRILRTGNRETELTGAGAPSLTGTNQPLKWADVEASFKLAAHASVGPGIASGSIHMKSTPQTREVLSKIVGYDIPASMIPQMPISAALSTLGWPSESAAQDSAALIQWLSEGGMLHVTFGMKQPVPLQELSAGKGRIGKVRHAIELLAPSIENRKV